MGSSVVDGTAGNGFDTLFLAKCVGEQGQVWSFDVQSVALNTTKEKLKKNNVEKQVNLILDGHENLLNHVSSKLDAGIFNLGWLPRGNKNIKTKVDTSLKAIKSTLNLLRLDGLVVVVIYPGHDEGLLEEKAIIEWSETLSQKQFQVLKYEFINRKNNPPYLLAIEKID